MPIKAHKLGPGSLKFGDVATEAEFAIAMKSVALEPDVDEGDLISVLSGDETDEGDEETYALTGTALQSYDLDSFIVWSHVHRGQIVPFRFTPDNDKALVAVGDVKVRAVQIGGDVKTRNESDFEFPGRNGFYRLIDADSDEEVTWTNPPAPAPSGADPDSPEWD